MGRREELQQEGALIGCLDRVCQQSVRIGCIDRVCYISLPASLVELEIVPLIGFVNRCVLTGY